MAAFTHSAIGNVASGSAFAFLQSAGAGGAAAATADAVVQGAGLVLAASGGGWKFVKAKL